MIKKGFPLLLISGCSFFVLLYRHFDVILPEYIKKAPPYDDEANYGYLTFRGGSPLRLECKTCSLVFGSGHMLGSNKGEEIDSRECVFRSNTAPTTGFENDVGKRTTVRAVTRFTYLLNVKSMTRSRARNEPLFDPNMPSSTILLKYGIQKKLENMHGLTEWPDMRLYLVQDKRYDKIIQLFKPISDDPIRMSSGFITINYAWDFCGEIHVYGLPESNVCDEVAKGLRKDVMYHYYEDTFGTECELYQFKLEAKKYGHHFVDEKKMFLRWMKNSSKLFFHTPEWKNN